MNNLQGDYIATVPIWVNDPMAAKVSITPSFDYNTKGKVRVELGIINIANKERYNPTSLKILLDGKSLYYKTNKEGQIYFTIKQSENFKQQTISVECDRYHKNIRIPYPPTDYELTFYPEGGNLIDGCINQVAFKAIGKDGQALQLAGTIVDEKGVEIASFKTLHQGMGAFLFKAQRDERYFALCNYEGTEKRFELLQSIEGIGLNVRKKEGNIHVSLLASERAEKPLYIIAQSKGALQFVNKWDWNKDEKVLKENDFPSGILHLLLVNDKRETLSERLVFCSSADQAVITEKVENVKFSTRSKIPVEVYLSGLKGENLKSESLSVSVVDNKDVDPYINPSILSTMLLTSDLRGYIADPNYYFQDKNKNRIEALDLLMLTHGWRRYNMPEVIKGNIEHPQIALEIGQTISGRVTSLVRAKPMSNSLINIFSLNYNFFDVATTDENGSFCFQGFELPDSTRYIIRAVSKKGSDRVELLIDKDTLLNIQDQPLLKFDVGYIQQDLIDYINKAEEKYTMENGIRMIYLNPIDIKGKKIPQYSTPYSIMADKKLGQDFFETYSIGNLSEALMYEPGVAINDTDVSFTRNQGRPAAVYIDGVYVQRFGDDGSGGSLSRSTLGYQDKLIRGSIDDIIPFYMIESIEIFKTAGSSGVFGPRGANGVVMINTKKGDYHSSPSPKQYNIQVVSPLGYQKPVEFYSPKYETNEERNNPDSDLRTTIYWNPNLSSDEFGKVLFDFYSADSKGSYTITLEGVSDDGKMIHYQKDVTID